MMGLFTSVDAEYLVVDNDAQRHKVKHVGKVVPHVGISVFARAFGIESI